MKDIAECGINATDGPLGQVCGAYFDDEAWVVRYLAVDLGPEGVNRSVMIPPIALGELQWSERVLTVALSKEQLMQSPDMNARNSLSRQHVMNCLDYYTGLGYVESDAEYQRLRTKGKDERASAYASRGEDDPHLRSASDVMTYRLDAADGTIGHILGLLIDEKSWAIRFMIVNTGTWWVGHQVLIAPESIDAVHWTDSDMIVDLKRQTVRDAPTYDAGTPFDNLQGECMYQHYGLAGYRSAESIGAAVRP